MKVNDRIIERMKVSRHNTRHVRLPRARARYAAQSRQNQFTAEYIHEPAVFINNEINLLDVSFNNTFIEFVK